MPIYLGPVNGLVQIHPLTDIEINPTRFGGTHVSLTGRRTVDYLGSANEYELKWRMLTPAEARFLYALHYRHVTGPLRFVLGDVMPNRLSRSAASTGFGGRDMSGVELSGGLAYPSTDWPSAVAPAGTSLRWTSYADGSLFQLDADQKVPVVPGESVNFSVWVKPTSADQVQIRIDRSNGVTSWGQFYDLAAGEWARLNYTVTVGTGVNWIQPSVEITALATGSTTEMLVAAAQVEAGTSPGEWMIGGGAPLVSVDSMSNPSPYGHFTDPELTLLEV